MPPPRAALRGRIEAVDSNGHLRSCPSDLRGIVRGKGNRSFGRLAGSRRIRVGSWNVGSLTRKFFELGDVLRRHKVDIACFQETKWKGSRAREGNGYKLWYSGSIARNGVGIILAGRHKDNVVRVTRRGDMIMAISVVIEGETVNVISAYAPQVGLSDADKKRFWDALDEMVRDAAVDGYAKVHGGFGFGDRNEEGCTVLEFATAHDLVVANSFFKKKDAHLITFQSGGHNTQIDYLLVRRGGLKACEDCRAFPDAAKDSLGVASARTHSTHRESWWFCEEVQTKVATKQSRFKDLLSCSEGNQEGIDRAKERYKVAKREAKIAVAKAKDKAYEDLYKKLDSKEGVNEIYKIAKARERRRMDIGNVKYIKDEGGRTITLSEESRPEGSGEVGRSSSPAHFDYYYSRINHEEARVALQKMGRNKAVGPDQILIEAWRCLGDEGVKWLTCLFNKIFSSAKMSDELRLSEFIPVYKNKVTCKHVATIERTNLVSCREGPRPRQFTYSEALWRSIGKDRDLHIAFLDLEKAFDSVPRELVWKTLLDKRTPKRYSRVIKDMYEGAKTRVRTTAGNTEYFPVNLGLHQGSAISPYLFTLILDELSRGIQENIYWCMIFADDIVLIADSAERLNNRLESWRKTMAYG
nr:retrovirus-related Pol polyprotein LINE-1 [Tanacetum cinerariifolium]